MKPATSLVARRLRPFAVGVLLLLLSIALSGREALAQDGYVHFEMQPVRPLEIARVAGHDYLLVCNTPDDRVEIYDTHDMSLMARIPVGARPVTVEWNPVMSSFYTANMLGDSITEVFFLDPGNGQAPTPRVNRSAHVGDSPTDVAFLPDGLSFFAPMWNDGAFAWYYSVLLLPAEYPLGLRVDMEFPMFANNPRWGMRTPRRMILDGLHLIVLNQRGGKNPADYDFDIQTLNIATWTHTRVGGLGTTNFDMELGVDGRLYVSGLLARSEIEGEPALEALPTGFAESHMWVVDQLGLPGGNTVEDRDLNLDAGGTPVSFAAATAMPTSVTLLQNQVAVEKVFVTGFSSDRIAVLEADPNAPWEWERRTIDVPVRNGYRRAGPRAGVMKTASTVAGDPGTRYYVLDTLDSTLLVIDPDTETVLSKLNLAHDPVPQEIRDGQEMLYSADLSSGGFVSCASCHIDARTDAVAWNLGVPGATTRTQPIPERLVDGITGGGQTVAYPDDKGPMVTQTLQGLANYIAFGEGRNLLDNSPYHWRGDRNVFTDFNAAYVGLMGAPNIGTTEQPRGVSEADMEAFRRLCELIALPPNPEQNLDRRYSGTFGDPNDSYDGSGALRGLKKFHTVRMDGGLTGGRSCVHCHALPEGSNNRLTASDSNNVFESAQLRNIRTREAWQEVDNITTSQKRALEIGVGHLGVPTPGAEPQTINTFIAAFGNFFPGLAFFEMVDLIGFVRQLDTGIAPIVGQTFTVPFLAAGGPGTATQFDLFEQQVREAHADAVVHIWTDSGVTHHYYDVTLAPPAWRQEDDDTLRTRSELLGLMSANNDRAVVRAVEVGAGPRAASASGVARVRQGSAPQQVTLEPMVPMVAWADIPTITQNWIPGSNAGDFIWDGPASGNTGIAPEPKSLKAMRIIQRELMRTATQFGIDSLHHEAPRRLQVAGHDIRPGARLKLGIPADPSVAPPYFQGEREVELELPLFPTDRSTTDGRPIWETAAELEPYIVHVLLAGGPWAPGVDDNTMGNVAEPAPIGTFDVLAWNLYHVVVENLDGSSLDAGWQRMTVGSR